MNTKIVEAKNKVSDTRGLVSTTILKTNIEEVENKILDHAKYITTPEFNKFAESIFDTKLKQANLAANSDVNAVSQRANKNKVKIEKLQTFNLSYFLGKNFSGYDGFQNTFVFQPTFSTTILNKK